MYAGSLCPVNFVVSFSGLYSHTNSNNNIIFTELLLSACIKLITLCRAFYLASYFAVSLWLLIEHGPSFIF